MLWHDFSLPYLIVGMYHGLGLVIWQFFQEIKGKNKKLRKLVDNKYVDPVSIFLTFNFVSLSMIVFYFDTNTIENILSKIFS